MGNNISAITTVYTHETKTIGNIDQLR